MGRPVLGQTKAGIQSCIAINKKDDDRRAILKNAQRAFSEVMREKEEEEASKKRKQLTQPRKISGIIYEGFSKIAAKMPPEAWYDMYVKPWHPELDMVGMRVLSQVISASSCE